jgi:hypothetical protein
MKERKRKLWRMNLKMHVIGHKKFEVIQAQKVLQAMLLQLHQCLHYATSTL